MALSRDVPKFITVNASVDVDPDTINLKPKGYERGQEHAPLPPKASGRGRLDRLN